MVCGQGVARRGGEEAGNGRTGRGGGSRGGRAVRSTQGAPGENLWRAAASSSPSQAGRCRA